MNLRQLIKEGEGKLKTYRDFVDTIDLLMDNKNDKKTLEFLLGMQRLEFENKMTGVSLKLEKMKKERVAELERESAECNAKVEELMRSAEVFGRTLEDGQKKDYFEQTVRPLMKKFKYEAVWMLMGQEDRNDVYFDLKRHLEFIKTKMR